MRTYGVSFKSQYDLIGEQKLAIGKSKRLSTGRQKGRIFPPQTIGYTCLVYYEINLHNEH